MHSMNVIEAITTWQAEGPDCGNRMFLLRFKHCNRSKENGGRGNCPFCDTLVKMRCQNEMKIGIKDIQKIVSEENLGLMVTGGEPTYSTNLKQTIELINKVECRLFNIETNGYKLIELISMINSEKNVHYIFSPKIFISDDLKEIIKIVETIKDNPCVYIKLVYEQRDLLIKFLDYLQLIKFPNYRVYLMPEGSTRDTLLDHAPLVFDAAEKYKFNFSSREHIIYYFV